jgi:hypothetical protein
MDTPPAAVTELTDDMRLIWFGPHAGGLRIDEDRASQEEVANFRAWAAKREHERQLRKAAEQAAQEFLGKLTMLLRDRVQRYDDPVLRAALTDELRFRNILTLEGVTYFTMLMGITIDELIAP